MLVLSCLFLFRSYVLNKYMLFTYVLITPRKKGGAVAQSVERATPDQEVVDSIPAPYSLGGCQY